MKDDWNFKPSKPREARGGIKSRSKRGGFGESWWAKRWISALERFSLGERLTRGRAYARSGQVLSIVIEPGIVTAMVQGTAPKPYMVTITMTTLTARQWNTLAATLSRQAIFAARLLAGEMPDDIEEAFKETGIPIFPDRARDMDTDCTCADWSNPCKHIAAVYYLLGEEFDRDPFLIFKLRGMEREELMAKLTHGPGRSRAGEPATAAKRQDGGAEGGEEAEEMEDEETASDDAVDEMPAGETVAPVASAHRLLRPEPRAFWGAGSYANELPIELRQPPVAAALPRQLGAFPFWRVDMPLHEALAPLYAAASTHTLRRMLEENSREQEPGEESEI